jgi:hypothetical protein
VDRVTGIGNSGEVAPPCWNCSWPATLVSLPSSNPRHSIWIQWIRSHRTPSLATFAKETLTFFSYKPAVLGLIQNLNFIYFNSKLSSDVYRFAIDLILLIKSPF